MTASAETQVRVCVLHGSSVPTTTTPIRGGCASLAVTNYAACGVALDGILSTDAAATGIAMITVDAHGSNEIVIVAGANNLLTPTEVWAVYSGHRCMLLHPRRVPSCVTASW
jgi:ribokinase